MSFFGKQFKKVDFENLEDIIKIMDWMNVSSMVRGLMSKQDSKTSFLDNGDGSIQYVIKTDEKELLNQKIPLDVEGNYTTPDGTLTKNKFTLDGDTLTSTMASEDGKTINFVREFSGDSMIMTVTADGLDGVKGLVKYQAV